MTEVCKIVNGVAPPIMNSLFLFRCNTHNVRDFQEIFTENRKTAKFGTETVADRAPFLWANLYTKYKNLKSLDEFQSKIKAWNVGYAKNKCKTSV